MDIIRSNGWVCNSYRAKKETIAMAIIFIVLAIAGIFMLRGDDLSRADQFTAWFLIFLMPIILLLFLCVENGKDIILCSIKAKQTNIFSDHIDK